MPKRRKPFTPRQEKINTTQQFQKTRRIRHIQEEQEEEEEEQEEEEEEQEEEMVDGKAALYIKKLMEDWSSINIVRPTGFREVTNVSVNKDISEEFWVKIKYRISEIEWLADTGSPRSFMQESTAKEIAAKYPDTKLQTLRKKQSASASIIKISK